MQRLLQALFFITIISAVFASVALPSGCNMGKVYTTTYGDGCLRCECIDNESKCLMVQHPCQAEGSYSEFHTFLPFVKPPRGQIFTGPTDGPENPWTGTTQTLPTWGTIGTIVDYTLSNSHRSTGGRIPPVEERELPEPQN